MRVEGLGFRGEDSEGFGFPPYRFPPPPFTSTSVGKSSPSGVSRARRGLLERERRRADSQRIILKPEALKHFRLGGLGFRFSGLGSFRV